MDYRSFQENKQQTTNNKQANKDLFYVVSLCYYYITIIFAIVRS
jgi:hypothetical protein